MTTVLVSAASTESGTTGSNSSAPVVTVTIRDDDKGNVWGVHFPWRRTGEKGFCLYSKPARLESEAKSFKLVLNYLKTVYSMRLSKTERMLSVVVRMPAEAPACYLGDHPGFCFQVQTVHPGRHSAMAEDVGASLPRGGFTQCSRLLLLLWSSLSPAVEDIWWLKQGMKNLLCLYVCRSMCFTQK